jgi:hypothetical protein
VIFPLASSQSLCYRPFEINGSSDPIDVLRVWRNW